MIKFLYSYPEILIIGVLIFLYGFIRVSIWMRKVERFIDDYKNETNKKLGINTPQNKSDMAREIKFRAWDNQSKCWYKPTHEAYKGQLWELLVSLGGRLCAHSIEKGHSVIIDESKFPDRYELMQFTGLLDRTGKEIYHEDIIEFNNGDKGIIACEKWVEFYVEWIGDPECEDQTRDFYRVRNAKIIGNIYENPELLTNK